MRPTTRDEIVISSDTNKDDQIIIKRPLSDIRIRLSGLDGFGYIKNLITHIPDKFTSILVKPCRDKTVYLKVNRGEKNTVSIHTDHHKTPGIITEQTEFEIDIDKLIDLITTNGVEIKSPNMHRE